MFRYSCLDNLAHITLRYLAHGILFLIFDVAETLCMGRVSIFADIDDCVGVSCGNGTCVDGINDYTCDCDIGFTGISCQTSR